MKKDSFYIIGYTIPEYLEENVINTVFELLPSFISENNSDCTVAEQYDFFIPTYSDQSQKIHLIFCVANKKPELKVGIQQDFLLLLGKDRVKKAIAELRRKGKINPEENFKNAFSQELTEMVKNDFIDMIHNIEFNKGFDNWIAAERIPKEMVLCLRLYAWYGNEEIFDQVFDYFGAVKVLPYLRIDNNQPQVNVRLEISPNATQEDILEQSPAIKRLKLAIKGDRYSRNKNNYEDYINFLKIDDDKNSFKGYDAIDEIANISNSDRSEKKKLAQIRQWRKRIKRS